jgi:predicted ATPase/DNA-binding CsgD family transcriptional regulator
MESTYEPLISAAHGRKFPIPVEPLRLDVRSSPGTRSPIPLKPGSAPALTATVAQPRPHNLPPQPTRLIGREDELTLLRALLPREEVHLLTLAGPGGVGKTRLAVAAAERVQSSFPGGVWFVDLAPVGDPALVVPTIAHVVGVREAAEQDPHETLTTFLRQRATLLLLDNLEHLRTAAPHVNAMLIACPDLTLLVTSREPLHLRREQVVELHPLSVPGPRRSSWTVANLEAVPAVEFFVERAQAADSTFALTARNAAAVAELTRRLDGLPLAVELAAARSRLLEPSALLTRLEDGLALLRWDTPDLPPRQRTLRATLDWSYALLSSAEQAVFRRLGVFAAGFTLEAVAAVAATPDLGVDALDVLAALVDKHLVRATGNPGDEPRFRLLATVREYAREQLTESEDEEATRNRHLAYYLTLVEQAERAMLGPHEERWLTRLESDMANLRLAQEWAISSGNAASECRLAAAQALFWVLRGYLQEGTRQIEAALSRSHDADPLLRARLRDGAGTLAEWSGQDKRAAAHFEASLEAAQEAGYPALTASVFGHLGALAYIKGDAVRARALVTEMLALARTVDSSQMIGTSYVYLVLFAIGPHGSPRERERLCMELDEPAIRLREAGAHRALAMLLIGRARVLVDVDVPAALAALREAVELARGLNDPLIISFVPWLASVLLAERLPAERVARLSGGVAALEARSKAVGGRTAIDVYGAPPDRAAFERVVAGARATLGDDIFAAAEAAGLAHSFEALLDELLSALADGERALAAPSWRATPSRHSGDLISPREREVLTLVADGRSNKAIAEVLFVAPSTIKSHVTSLLTKLGADNRAQLAAIATQRQLLSV